MEIENAKITKASITMADHGCLTFWVYLEGYGWGCGFGGYCIGKGFLGGNDDEFTAEYGDGLVAMMRVMNVVGVEKWEDLPGKYIRCKVGRGSEGVKEIGNIIKNKWFNIADFFKQKIEEHEHEQD